MTPDEELAAQIRRINAKPSEAVTRLKINDDLTTAIRQSHKAITDPPCALNSGWCGDVWHQHHAHLSWAHGLLGLAILKAERGDQVEALYIAADAWNHLAIYLERPLS